MIYDTKTMSNSTLVRKYISPTPPRKKKLMAGYTRETWELLSIGLNS